MSNQLISPMAIDRVMGGPDDSDDPEPYPYEPEDE